MIISLIILLTVGLIQCGLSKTWCKLLFLLRSDITTSTHYKIGSNFEVDYLKIHDRFLLANTFLLTVTTNKIISKNIPLRRDLELFLM